MGCDRTGVDAVRGLVRPYLAALGEGDLDVRHPYDGSILELRAGGITLRYTVLEASAHHYFHIGEIATKRAARGQDVGDYPGLMLGYL